MHFSFASVKFEHMGLFLIVAQSYTIAISH